MQSSYWNNDLIAKSKQWENERGNLRGISDDIEGV